LSHLGVVGVNFPVDVLVFLMLFLCCCAG
jgi:hypothetical protein